MAEVQAINVEPGTREALEIEHGQIGGHRSTVQGF